MSKAIFNKWNKTGLLNGLPFNEKVKLARLLENQAIYFLKSNKKYLQNQQQGLEPIFKLFFNCSFPLIRRIFSNLEFSWDATASVEPLIEMEDGSITASKCRVYTYETEFPFYDDGEAYFGISAEVELVAFLSESIAAKLNKKFKNKHVVFKTPICATRKDERTLVLSFTGAVSEF